MKKRIKVYVAGAYSADNVIDVLRNIGKGEKTCAKLFELGFAPFSPWADRSFIINNPDVEFSVEGFYEYSIEWLKVSNILLMLNGWEGSKGSMAEHELAGHLGIPVCYSIDELIEYRTHFNTTRKGNN